jgi:hypothetical protein
VVFLGFLPRPQAFTADDEEEEEEENFELNSRGRKMCRFVKLYMYVLYLCVQEENVNLSKWLRYLAEIPRPCQQVISF